MIFLNIYFIVAISIAIFVMLLIRFDKSFDDFVKGYSKGAVEIGWLDKITYPIILGLAWPYAFFLLIRKIVHG